MPTTIADMDVKNWQSLMAAIDQVLNSCQTPLFRGQHRFEWRLTPSINRYVQKLPQANAAAIEFQAITRFRGEAHAQIPTTALPRDPFALGVFDNYVEWLALMQHHGAPTRLLDWSFSPYVGLYFAISGEPNEDAALWFFDQAHLWQSFCTRFNVAPQVFFDYSALPAQLLTNPQDPQPFVFSAMKKMRSAREIAQQGVFTFCDHLLADHQAALESVAAGSSGRIRIPAALKHECGWRLRAMNLTPAALFPGVDGVCQSIREDFERARSWAV